MLRSFLLGRRAAVAIALLHLSVAGAATFVATDANIVNAVKNCATDMTQTNPANGPFLDCPNMGSWDTSAVTTMKGLFSFRRVTSKGLNVDLSKWDVSQVTDMEDMFLGADTFNADLSEWDVSKVTNMGKMFSGANKFNGGLSEWDVSKVTDMNNMFNRNKVFNQDLSKWDVSKVTDMSNMFAGTEVFNQDLSKWDVSKVTDMKWMFYDAIAFNQDLSKWDVSSVTDMSKMFSSFSIRSSGAFNQDLSKWDVSNVTMTDMFENAEAMTYVLCWPRAAPTTFSRTCTAVVSSCTSVPQRRGPHPSCKDMADPSGGSGGVGESGGVVEECTAKDDTGAVCYQDGATVNFQSCGGGECPRFTDGKWNASKAFVGNQGFSCDNCCVKVHKFKRNGQLTDHTTGIVMTELSKTNRTFMETERTMWFYDMDCSGTPRATFSSPLLVLALLNVAHFLASV